MSVLSDDLKITLFGFIGLIVDGLVRHLLLIVLYLIFGLAWLSQVSFPLVWGLSLIVLGVGLVSALAATWRFYHWKKRIFVHLFGAASAIGGLFAHSYWLGALPLAYGLTLLMMFWPCHHCIAYRAMFNTQVTS